MSITNFQSHKNTKLDFSEGVNVIIGASNCGKSAIIRAIKLVCQNRPTGDRYRSKWGGDTKIDIIHDNYIVSRIRNNTENKYILTDSEDLIEFNAISSGIPKEIEDTLSINEINLQQQLDQPFLLAETPGKIAAFFNKIAGIDIIDKANQKVEKQIRSIKATIDFKSDDLAKAKEQLKSYRQLDKIERKLITLEITEKVKNGLTIQLKEIDLLFASIAMIKQQIKENSEILKLENKVNSLLLKIKRKNELEQDKNKLENYMKTIYVYEKEINKYKNIYLLEPVILCLQQKFAKIKQLQADLASFTDLTTKYTTLLIKLNETGLKLKKAQDIFNQNLIICPLCGTKIK
jgi:chromosome segregation ATPase